MVPQTFQQTLKTTILSTIFVIRIDMKESRKKKQKERK